LTEFDDMINADISYREIVFSFFSFFFFLKKN